MSTPYTHLTSRWPHNLKGHNLCEQPDNMPTELLKVLGLGLGYCVSLKRDPRSNPIDLQRLRQDIRTKCMLGAASDPDFDIKLYVKRKDWKPDPATPAIEAALDDFEEKSDKLFRHSRSSPHLPNLTPTEIHSLRTIPKEKRYCVVNTDKNLGPCIMEMPLMIRRCLHDHLLDTTNYTECTEAEATAKNEHTFRTILQTMVDDRPNLDDQTMTYFRRTLCTHRGSDGRVTIPPHLHLPYFYIAPKVHKTPWNTRPVLSAVASILEPMS